LERRQRISRNEEILAFQENAGTERMRKLANAVGMRTGGDPRTEISASFRSRGKGRQGSGKGARSHVVGSAKRTPRKVFTRGSHARKGRLLPPKGGKPWKAANKDRKSASEGSWNMLIERKDGQRRDGKTRLKVTTFCNLSCQESSEVLEEISLKRAFLRERETVRGQTPRGRTVIWTPTPQRILRAKKFVEDNFPREASLHLRGEREKTGGRIMRKEIRRRKLLEVLDQTRGSGRGDSLKMKVRQD